MQIFTAQSFRYYLGQLLALNTTTKCIEKIKCGKNVTVLSQAEFNVWLKICV